MPGFFFFGGISKLGGKLTGNIAKTAIQNIDKAVLCIAAEMPIRMGGEFAEEYLQAVLEPDFRNMAFNEHNEIRLFSPDNFYQGMIGAFTAGLLESGPAVAKNISNTQIGHGVNEAHKADELIGRALMLDTRTEAFGLASKLVDGSAHKNNYNVGELLRTYVEADGDTAFMSMPNTEGIANTQETVRTTLEQEKAETPEKGATSGVAVVTSPQIGQSIREVIRRNAVINPEAMQKTVTDGMSALIAIETRIRAESSNINHSGIGIDSIHYEYMGYLRGEMELDTTAWSMAEAIKTVMRTQTLTEAETVQLTGVLAEIVGGVELAQAYVNGINASMQGLMAEIDSERSVGDNKSKKRSMSTTPQEYYAYAGEIGKQNDLNKAQKLQLLQEAYEALGNGNRADVLMPADAKFLTDAGFDLKGRPDYRWPKHWGLKGAKAISRIANVLPKILMRNGFLGGNTFTELPKDGIPYNYDEMSLPYKPNTEASHQAICVDGGASYFDIIDAIRKNDIDALNALLESNGVEMVNDAEMARLYSRYLDFVKEAKDRVGGLDATYGLYGTVEKWASELTGEIYLNGGAPQYTLPLSVKELIRLGIYQEKEI